METASACCAKKGFNGFLAMQSLGAMSELLDP
jgi:hypothetical protein